jgi:hypothetical protein
MNLAALFTSLIVVVLLQQETEGFSTRSTVVPRSPFPVRTTTTTSTEKTSTAFPSLEFATRLKTTNDDDFERAFTRNIRKNRLTRTYAAASVLYFGFGLFNLKMQTSLPYALLLASGHFMAAGLAWILKDQDVKDNLFLFTNKRFNLGLLEYGICQLIVLMLAKRVPGGNSIFGLGPVLLTLSSLQGYTYGVRGLDYSKGGPMSLVKDLFTGVGQTLLSIVKIPKNINSAVYTVATLLVFSMKVAKLQEVVDIVSKKGDTSSLLVPIARLGRLALMTILVYSLKDAADRGMIDSPTFIKLNALASASFASLALYIGKATAVGGMAAFLAVFCGAKGVVSIVKKKEE